MTLFLLFDPNLISHRSYLLPFSANFQFGAGGSRPPYETVAEWSGDKTAAPGVDAATAAGPAQGEVSVLIRSARSRLTISSLQERRGVETNDPAARGRDELDEISLRRPPEASGATSEGAEWADAADAPTSRGPVEHRQSTWKSVARWIIFLPLFTCHKVTGQFFILRLSLTCSTIHFGKIFTFFVSSCNPAVLVAPRYVPATPVANVYVNDTVSEVSSKSSSTKVPSSTYAKRSDIQKYVSEVTRLFQWSGVTHVIIHTRCCLFDCKEF